MILSQYDSKVKEILRNKKGDLAMREVKTSKPNPRFRIQKPLLNNRRKYEMCHSRGK